MRFTELTLRGVGSTGSVYRAWDPLLERWVALKIVQNVDTTTSLRILREARAQAQLEHPNICRVYEVLRDADRAVIAMQFVEGKPVDEMARELEPEDLLRTFVKVADALDYAHRHGLVHGDVKPGNILVERRNGYPHPIVVDFGLARRRQENVSSRDSAVRGTPAFMAPEQVIGERRSTISAATDVYGLTATLYDAVVGRPPHVGRNVAETLVSVVRDQPQSPRELKPEIGRDLEAILLKGLAFEPGERYARAGDLAEDLRRLLEGQPIAARPAGVVSVLRGSLKRSPARWLEALLVLAVIFAGVQLWRQRRIERERVQLAQAFGRQVEDAASRLRHAALLPVHDVSAERASAERQIASVSQQMQRLGPAAEGPGRYALGLAYLALGREEAARDQLLKAWELGERTPEVAAGLGRAFGSLYQSVLLDLQRPGGPAEASSVEQARAELLEPALRFLRQAVAQNPEAPYIAALLAFYEERWPEAIGAARRAQASEATYREAVYLEAEAVASRAESLALAGDLVSAREGFDRARQLYSDLAARVPSDAGLWTAACLLESRQANRLSEGAAPDDSWLERAVELCRNALAVDPSFADAWIVQARLHWVHGQLLQRRGASPLAAIEAGLASAARGADLEPQAASAHAIASGLHRLRASWQSAHGEDASRALEGAVTSARRAIALQPGLAAAYNNLGNALYLLALDLDDAQRSESALTSAVEAFERCISLGPKLAACHVNLGNCWKARADRAAAAGTDPALHLHRATLAYEAALPLNPNFAPLQNNLGNVHLTLAESQMKRDEDPIASLDRAKAYYRRALELRERYAIAALNLGITERMRAEWNRRRQRPTQPALDAARAALADAEAWNPEDADTPLERARVELVAIRAGAGSSEAPRRAALAALARAARIQPNAPALAELRRELGDRGAGR
jgi:hypothetical protein